jgi:MFS family permease
VTVGSAERRAVGAVFLLFGVDMGTFASRLPWIADRLHLTSGLLGVSVGLMTAVGAVVTIPFAARLLHRYGARASTRVLIAATGASLVLPVLAPQALVLGAVMLVRGAVYGTCDNAINAQAVEAERRAGRSIMSGLHGMWSVGVLAGALIGSLAAREHIDPRLQFAVVGAVIAIGGSAATSWFVSTPASDEAAELDVPRFVWPRGIILLIGMVGFAAIFVETAGNDWSAVYMHWVLHASQSKAALATGIFAGSMAAGRLCGDALIRRIGPRRCVRACGLLGTAGCLLVAVSGSTGVALAGFLIIGVGASVVIPLVFAAAGNTGASPAIGVAGVATISYGAGLAAPSAMGGIAEVSSLRVAFACVALLAAAVAVGAGLLERPLQRDASPQPAELAPEPAPEAAPDGSPERVVRRRSA